MDSDENHKSNSDGILSAQDELTALTSEVQKVIEDAVGRLERPNRYIRGEIITYTCFFWCYLICAIVMVVVTMCVCLEWTSCSVRWTMPDMPSSPNLFDYLHFHGPQLTCFIVLGILINLFSRSRRHIIALNEDKRNIEFLLGVVEASMKLCPSDKLLTRLLMIMDALEKVAVIAFHAKSNEQKPEGDLDEILKKMKSTFSHNE